MRTLIVDLKKLGSLCLGLFLFPAFAHTQAICTSDRLPPVLNNCPQDVSFAIPPGDCGVPVNWSNPYADADNCIVTNIIPTASFFSFHEGPGNGNNGQLIMHGVDSMTIVGTTNGNPVNGSNQFNVCFYARCSGQVSFNWRAKMNNGDGFAGDRVRVMITHAVHGANVNAILTAGNGSSAVGTFLSVFIQEGDRICFEVQSDNTLGVDSFTIRDFNFIAGPVNVIQTKGPSQGDLLPPGIYPVEYTASDCSGNVSVCNFNIHVESTEPPAFISECPDDLTINLSNNGACDSLLQALIPKYAGPCQPVLGFTYGLNPLLYGVQTSEAAQGGNGDGIIGTDGLVYVSPGKDSLIMVGINNGTPGNLRNDTSVLSTCLYPSCSGTIQFDWRASIGIDGFRRDEAGIIYNGKDSILGQPPAASFAQGTVSLHTNGVDPLCFYVRSTNMSMEDTFIVTNFSFVPDSIIPVQTEGPDLTQPVQPGTYHVAYEATDCYGRTNSCSFNLTVVRRTFMACNDRVHVSLDQNCQAFITPGMIVNESCTNTYRVELSKNGKPVPNPFDGSYLSQIITVKVKDTLSGNSCWGTIYVEDKFPPKLICPEPDTVFCNQTDYLLKEATVIEKCTDVTKHLVSDVTIKYPCDSAMAGKRTLTYYYTDAFGNRSDTCQQCVYFKRIDPETDIVWPRDTAFDCTVMDTVPSTQITGVPTVGGREIYPGWGLCKIGMIYEDQILYGCPKTRKILRKWTYVDWCRPFEESITIHIQYIAIKDEKGPLIACAQNTVVSTNLEACTADVLLESPTVLKECSQTSVQVGYKFIANGDTANFDGSFTDHVAKQASGLYLISDLPLGLNWVVFRVSDECGNYSDCATEVLVEDKVPPTPVCDQKTVVTLTTYGTAEVEAASLDDGSHDNCGILKFEARRMDEGLPCDTASGKDWAPSVRFCCADINQTRMVSMRVWDVHGNFNTCMVEVLIQDKLPPAIICPPDITVSCEYDFSDLSVFGEVRSSLSDRKPIIINDPKVRFSGIPIDGFAYDGCGVRIVDTATYDVRCAQGKIYRRFDAFDPGGLRSSCTQTIQVNDYTPDNVKIKWPDDFVNTTICSDKPDLTPDVTGKPVITGADKCSNVLLSYSDEVFTLDPDACLKILRKWVVIDWCVYNPNDKNPSGYWSRIQIIKVSNSVGPVFKNACKDLTIDAIGQNCSSFIDLHAYASDDCTDSTELVWRHVVDLFNDGNPDPSHSGPGNDASGIYPYGTHKVQFFVTDKCNNTSQCSYLIHVRDAKAPTPYCIGQIVTTIMPRSQSIEVWAKDFNLNSSDDCTPKDSLKYYFLLNGKYVPSLVFNCSNIGLNTLRIYVVDQAGNWDFCEVTMEIQDPNHVCPTGLHLEGKVITLGNQAIKDVRVSWERTVPPGSLNTLTDQEGKYVFQNLTFGMNYTIKADKTGGDVNGVTTYDIVLIQRHILGIQSFDNPYKYLASDVNSSCSVTAADIAEIRRLILGKISAFSKCPSWKFVPVKSTLPEPVDPCVFESSLKYEPLQDNHSDADFYGVKMGDVNFDVDGSQFGNWSIRSGADLGLYANERYVEEGTQQTVPVYASQLISYEGMQFTLEFESKALELNKVTGAQIEVQEDQLAVYENKIAFSLTGQQIDLIDIEKPLFYLSFFVHHSCKLSDVIKLNQSGLRAEWYDRSAVIHPVHFEINELNAGSGNAQSYLFQNRPNPFSESTTIGFNLSADQEVEFLFYSSEAELLHREEGIYSKGYHELVVHKGMLNTSGFVFLQMKTKDYSATKKLILIR